MKDDKAIILIALGRSGSHAISSYITQSRKCERIEINNQGDIKLAIKDNTNYEIIYLIRDYYNMLCSMIYTICKLNKTSWLNLRFVKEHYKKITKLYLKKPNKCILYNKWYFSETYRKGINKNLGLFSTKIPKFRNSFCSTTLGADFDNSDVNNLKIDERYKLDISYLKEYDIYDEEINELTKQVFGEDIYDWDYLKKKFKR